MQTKQSYSIFGNNSVATKTLKNIVKLSVNSTQSGTFRIKIARTCPVEKATR